MRLRTFASVTIPLCAAVAAVAMIASTVLVGASQQAAVTPAPPSARETAPLDLTGYWVSVVTEDWRWRMMTPVKGDAPGVPLSVEGRRVADAWDLAKDNASGNQCKAFGVGGIMRMPGRIHITWQDDSSLRMDFDAGKQTRIIHMGREVPKTAPSLQGISVGRWQLRNTGAPILEEEGGRRGRGRAAGAGAQQKGSLKVVTSAVRPGYFRKNGLPYSENAVITEYFDRHEDFGAQWFTVLTIIDDPKYLVSPFVTTTHFKQEATGAKWNPTACETPPPSTTLVAKGES